MEYTELGGSSARISRLAFGCEQLGGVDWGQVDVRGSCAAVHAAADRGINFFDTADVYGLGKSEVRLAEILGPHIREVTIATKFGVNWREKGNGRRAATFRDSSRRRVREALEGSLRRLRIDQIFLYQINWPDPSTPIGETLDELNKFRREGKIGHIGLCNFSVSLLREACAISDIAAVQLPYNLLDRRAEEGVLSFCRERGIGVLVYGPLAQGLLTGKYKIGSCFGPDDRRSRLEAFRGEKFRRNVRIVEAVSDVARKYGKTPGQVALRWVLRNPAVMCAIVGNKTPEQVRENVDVFDWDFRDEDYLGLAQASVDEPGEVLL